MKCCVAITCMVICIFFKTSEICMCLKNYLTLQNAATLLLIIRCDKAYTTLLEPFHAFIPVS